MGHWIQSISLGTASGSIEPHALASTGDPSHRLPRKAWRLPSGAGTGIQKCGGGVFPLLMSFSPFKLAKLAIKARIAVTAKPEKRAASTDRANYLRGMSDRLLTSGELARALGISHRSITHYAKTGQLDPALTTPGGQYRWDLDDVKRQLRELNERRRRD